MSDDEKREDGQARPLQALPWASEVEAAYRMRQGTVKDYVRAGLLRPVPRPKGGGRMRFRLEDVHELFGEEAPR